MEQITGQKTLAKEIDDYNSDQDSLKTMGGSFNDAVRAAGKQLGDLTRNAQKLGNALAGIEKLKKPS